MIFGKISASLSARALPAVFFFCAVTPLAAHADERRGPPETNWTVSVGAAALYAPAFEGSDDYTVTAVPDVRVKYKEDFFASIPEGIGYNVITRERGEDGWKVGPLAKLKFGRDEDGEGPFTVSGDTDDLRGMSDVDTAIEIGGFADYQWRNVQSRVEFRQGMGGHEGFIASAQMNYTGNAGPVRFGAGPRITWASADYNQTYFGIDARQSARTGLAAYDPDGGIASYGVGGFAAMPLTDSVSLTAFAGYDRLGEQAADSPLVEERGSDDAVTAGIGVSYRFGWN